MHFIIGTCTSFSLKINALFFTVVCLVSVCACLCRYKVVHLAMLNSRLNCYLDVFWFLNIRNNLSITHTMQCLCSEKLCWVAALLEVGKSSTLTITFTLCHRDIYLFLWRRANFENVQMNRWWLKLLASKADLFSYIYISMPHFKME